MLRNFLFRNGSSPDPGAGIRPPADIADKIEIEEARCMNHCKNTTAKYNRGPFVLVNDELIEEANFEKVVNKVREILNREN